MALIKCGECGKEISDKANMCVHCGNPLNEDVAQKSNVNINEPLTTSDTSNMNTNETLANLDTTSPIENNKKNEGRGGCLGCIGMIVLVGAVLSFCGQSDENYDPTNPRHVNPVLERNWYDD